MPNGMSANWSTVFLNKLLDAGEWVNAEAVVSAVGGRVVVVVVVVVGGGAVVLGSVVVVSAVVVSASVVSAPFLLLCSLAW